ncbi:MAG: hypothetical protein WDZ91_15085 [Paenibacillaceae bacterium]
MKKIIFIILMITILVGGYAGLRMKTIVAEQVYGTSICGTDCYATVTKSSKHIPSTNAELRSMQDDSRLDTAFIVVYEENRWFESHAKLIKLLKFQRTFSEEDYANNTTLDYAKLVEESIESVDRDHMVMTRVYEIHHKNDSTIDLLPESIITPVLSNPKDVKAWIANNDPEYLKLKQLTVVDSELLSQWKLEQYTPELEYCAQSPEGLTFEKVVNMGEQKIATEQIIDQKLGVIMSSPATASNPHDYIKEHQAEFDYLVSKGDVTLDHFLNKFNVTDENGLQEYIMALACADIVNDEETLETWSSGREWYQQYIKNLH